MLLIIIIIAMMDRAILNIIKYNDKHNENINNDNNKCTCANIYSLYIS